MSARPHRPMDLEEEAADWTSMSSRTITTWVQTNKVQWQYTAGGQLRIWDSAA